VDAERDHIEATVTAADPRARLTVLRDFFTGYHSRNGGGDLIRTDGDLPVLDVSALEGGGPPAASAAPLTLGAATRRPSQVVFGVLVTGLRALVYLALAALLLAGVGWSGGSSAPEQQAVGVIVGLVFLVAGLTDLVLAVATFRGRNWARLAVCGLSLLSLLGAFVSEEDGRQLGPLPLAISVLVLMALSSESARAFATRPRTPNP